jgi:hypothetical protein
MVKDDPSEAPVPLSEDEVAALVRGQMPDERIASILASKLQRADVAPPEGPGAAAAPIDVSAEELAALAAGRDVEAVNARLEKAAARREEAPKPSGA